MAKATKKTEVVVTLKLTQQEAEYIRGLTQNHIGDWEEGLDEYNARLSIFESLATLLK